MKTIRIPRIVFFFLMCFLLLFGIGDKIELLFARVN